MRLGRRTHPALLVFGPCPHNCDIEHTPSITFQFLLLGCEQCGTVSENEENSRGPLTATVWAISFPMVSIHIRRLFNTVPLF